MHSSKQAVVFRKKNNRNLFGILHRPEKLRQDAAIIFLSPGIKNRVGPHRLYIKMAERFTQMGFAVLRMDPEGLGDSEGEINETLTADVYASIQLGRYIEDTISMMDWLSQKSGISQFILAGLCGGAITALLAAERDGRAIGILSLGIPCVLSSSAIDPGSYITMKQLESIRNRYLTKILNPKAWMRFLSFKSDYRLIIRSLVKPVMKKQKKFTPQNEGKTQDRQSISSIATNLNPHFHRAFLKFVSKNKILFIFSEVDRLFWEFEEKYLNVYKKEVDSFTDNFEIDIVKDSNHVFSFSDWQNEMLSISERWIKKLFSEQ